MTGFKPRCEQLEPRDVPATFTVNDTRDIALVNIPTIPQQGGPPVPAFMTLRAALESSEASPGADIINFAPGLLAGAAGEEGGSKPHMTWLHISMPLTKANPGQEVTIGGQGADKIGVMADATEANKFRILNMTGGTVTVHGLAFSGGWAPGDGGAIQVIAGELSLDGCQLYNNQADGSGGAVAHVKPVGAGAPPDVGPLTVVGCLFANNHALGTDGGAIFTGSKNSLVTVQRSTFQYNTAARHGGAIKIAGGNQRQVTIESANGVPTNFLNNTAQRGGAIALVGDFVEVQVHGAVFTQNQGTVSAGAIYASGGVTSYLTVTQSQFTGNWVPGGGRGAVGGAVVLSTQSGTFGDCTFTNNTAAYGGAFFVETGFAAGQGQGPALTLVNSSFVNNIAIKLAPMICYAGILNDNLWVYDYGSGVYPDGVVAFVEQP